MAYNNNITHVGAHGLADKISTLISKYRAHAARRKVYRDTLRELRALSARDLADLGLHHSMLTRVAYQAAYDN